MNKNYLKILLLMTMSTVVDADYFYYSDIEKMPASIKKQLQKDYNINVIFQWSTGKLDDTNTEYYAVLSDEKFDKNYEDMPYSLRLFLFAKQANGQLKKVLESINTASCGKGCEIEISKQSLFVEADHVHDTALDYNNVIKQYKNINGHYVLIGEEQLVSLSGNMEMSEQTLQTFSINYLTKKSIFTSKELLNGKTKKTSTRTLRVAEKKLRLLEEDYGTDVNYSKLFY